MAEEREYEPDTLLAEPRRPDIRLVTPNDVEISSMLGIANMYPHPGSYPMFLIDSSGERTRVQMRITPEIADRNNTMRGRHECEHPRSTGPLYGASTSAIPRPLTRTNAVRVPSDDDDGASVSTASTEEARSRKKRGKRNKRKTLRKKRKTNRRKKKSTRSRRRSKSRASRSRSRK